MLYVFMLYVGAIGFGPIGVVGGSIAAAWQSSIGNVASGSLFALCQKFGKVILRSYIKVIMLLLLSIL